MPETNDKLIKGLDYDVAMPEGFVNSTSGNDTCRSIYNAEKGLKVFLEYADISKREEEAPGPRFSVHLANDEAAAIGADGHETGGGSDYALLNTDDWAQVEAFVADHQPATPAPGR